MTQREWRRRARLGAGAALTAAVVGIGIAVFPPSAGAADPAAPDASGNELGKHDEVLLEQARVAGKKSVEVLVAADEGAGAEGLAQLDRLGATVNYRADELGYIRAEVPIDKVKKLPGLPGIGAVDVDGTTPIDDPDPGPDGVQNPTPQPAPDANTPRVNPYMPTQDTGAAQWVDRNPKLDGRGTTVGIIDLGVDLDHPSLTTTSTGERKITDWVTYTDSRFTDGANNDDDPTWLDMSKPAAGPSIASDAGTYQAPNASADLRFAIFDERDERLGGEVGNDVNRDGNPAGSDGRFGVLWDPATDTVWVDTNQNKNFADDMAMTNYKVRYDVNHFGTDDPATAVAESMPFVVQTDKKNQSVNIGIVSGSHGSHVAGIVAGNSLFGGQMSGAAPGAKLVSVRVCLFVTGCTDHAMVEGMIYAARDANVDVINMSIGGLPWVNDGNNARAEIYNRLIDEYDVQMFISAGNDGAGMNTVGDPSVVDKVVSVGSYITRSTWQRNYGSDTTTEENLHPFSSRGPREDGGFKPTIVAPGSAISPIPTWMAGEPLVGTYELPPGYGMLNGTSMASPQAAGVGALLVGAAKDRKVQHAPEQLRQALTSTARFIPGYQAYEQGNGLIDVQKAWNQLKSNIATVDISSSVEVHTTLADKLAKPGVGVGINDREGVKPGDSYSREYTFTRTSGPANPVTYHVSWVGNDGTFSSAKNITLRKGSAVKFRVDVNPAEAGAHSAILNLDSPMSTGIEYQTLNTVIAAEDFTADNDFTISHGGTIGRNDTTSYFFRVAEGSPSLKVDLQGGGTAAGAGQIRFLRFHPYGYGIEDNGTPNCYNPPTPSGCDSGSPTSRTITNPTPGVWEVLVEARRTSDSEAAPYTLTTSVLGATVTPNPDTIPTATIGQPIQREYQLANAFRSFTGRAAGTNLGSAKIDTPTIADGQNSQFPVNVTEGAEELRVKIGNTADLSADLDLAVFDCTSGSCKLAGQSADGDSEEAVTIQNPTPGRWVVLVAGYSVPAGQTTYDYLDVFSGAAFGTIAVDDANADRPNGAQWTVAATVTPLAAPEAGRVITGNVLVRTDLDEVVGTGDVVIQSVS
jgi:subtilase family protein